MKVVYVLNQTARWASYGLLASVHSLAFLSLGAAAFMAFGVGGFSFGALALSSLAVGGVMTLARPLLNKFFSKDSSFYLLLAITLGISTFALSLSGVGLLAAFGATVLGLGAFFGVEYYSYFLHVTVEIPRRWIEKTFPNQEELEDLAMYDSVNDFKLAVDKGLDFSNFSDDDWSLILRNETYYYRNIVDDVAVAAASKRIEHALECIKQNCTDTATAAIIHASLRGFYSAGNDFRPADRASLLLEQVTEKFPSLKLKTENLDSGVEVWVNLHNERISDAFAPEGLPASTTIINSQKGGRANAVSLDSMSSSPRSSTSSSSFRSRN